MVYVGTEKDVGAEDNMLKLVYDLKPVGYKFECFDDLKKRVETEWKSLPLKYNVIGDCLQKKIDNRKEESKKMKEELDKAK
jgi:hypothetical protein